ncbi:hypothetical protein BDA99DRAFT_560829 [Phascolomyces articulosus]|uniref:Uncharacterized protein n=1 Tax=Phascolomyces articulosus TaxID=60185 RepID=A0AAD5PDJ4_9FUNG|nr:hypothetical protein BDA99DRAFT_560829 [Phascolomyces articulosus]
MGLIHTGARSSSSSQQILSSTQQLEKLQKQFYAEKKDGIICKHHQQIGTIRRHSKSTLAKQQIWRSEYTITQPLTQTTNHNNDMQQYMSTNDLITQIISEVNSRKEKLEKQDTLYEELQRFCEELNAPEAEQRRIAAAAHAFTPLSSAHKFNYLYFPLRAHLPAGQIRAKLRHLRIDNSKILDIQYPGYYRLQLVHGLQCHRAQRALKYIRKPLCYAIAMSFQAEGCISIEELQSFSETRRTRRDNPKTRIADIFHIEEEDQVMEDHHFNLDPDQQRLRKQVIDSILKETQNRLKFIFINVEDWLDLRLEAYGRLLAVFSCVDWDVSWDGSGGSSASGSSSS